MDGLGRGVGPCGGSSVLTSLAQRVKRFLILLFVRNPVYLTLTVFSSKTLLDH